MSTTQDILKGLECAIDENHFGFTNCHSCPWRKDVDHLQYVCDGDKCTAEAIALIKSHEQKIEALQEDLDATTRELQRYAYQVKEQEPRVILKREIGSLPKETVVWVEQRDTIDEYRLNIECFRGVKEHIIPATGNYELCIDYIIGHDDVSDYGKQYRFWTQRPTWAQMMTTEWEGEMYD